MQLDEYKALALRTAKQMDGRDNIIHAALGLSSEAGEITTTVKKMFAYNQAIDYDNIVEELGDILWFCALMSHSLHVSLDYVAEQNIEKLRKRYPEKFSDDLASLRLDKQHG
jgi:NTP pyrophosphatase (non-canonical NTP hydrolase)